MGTLLPEPRSEGSEVGRRCAMKPRLGARQLQRLVRPQRAH
jgi:hypothetical protein